LNTGTRNLEITGVNPAELFGINDANFRHIKTFFPKLKITARGNVITLIGDDEVMDEFERKFNLMVQRELQHLHHQQH
jgi:phosphate starvation-inducible PhoH-like protein